MEVDELEGKQVLSPRGEVEQAIREWRELVDLVTSKPWKAFEVHVCREIDGLAELMENESDPRVLFQLQGGRRQLKRLLEMRNVCEQQLQELQDELKELDAAHKEDS